MKYCVLLFLAVVISSCAPSQKPRYVFFLHNMYLELYPKGTEHPEYGRVEYDEILKAFRDSGFTVFSEIRPKNTPDLYATKIAAQIDSLIATGVDPSNITVVGTSRGGYLTKMVSSTLRNPNLNFVLIGCCTPDDDKDFPDIYLYGNVLSIYESSDSATCSCSAQKKRTVPHYKEIVLHTGVRHGYLYRALPAWINPSIAWAKGDYSGATCSDPLVMQLDSLLQSDSVRPFNGIALVSQAGRTLYVRCSGYADTAKRNSLQLNNQFVIGSVSKQLTAVLVLRELDKGLLNLTDPISKYLPNLPSWSDTVSIHHLLTHTHGIVALDSPLIFKPGDRFDYSQIGYVLLGQIVEKTSGKSFADLSAELFASSGMKNTFHPSIHKYDNLVAGMAIDNKGKYYCNPLEDVSDYYTAAGRYISTVSDLATWTNLLHSGKLLSPHSYELMMTKYAVRPHPLLGPTDYGYGITIVNSKEQLGQLGFAPGFVSLCYYLPPSKTTVIVLINLETYPDDHNASFYYPLEIKKAVAKFIK